MKILERRVGGGEKKIEFSFNHLRIFPTARYAISKVKLKSPQQSVDLIDTRHSCAFKGASTLYGMNFSLLAKACLQRVRLPSVSTHANNTTFHALGVDSCHNSR